MHSTLMVILGAVAHGRGRAAARSVSRRSMVMTALLLLGLGSCSPGKGDAIPSMDAARDLLDAIELPAGTELVDEPLIDVNELQRTYRVPDADPAQLQEGPLAAAFRAQGWQQDGQLDVEQDGQLVRSRWRQGPNELVATTSAVTPVPSETSLDLLVTVP